MIYAFGDSFTAGLGVDRTWEESQLGNHPKWDVMSDDEKSIQRHKVEIFRNEKSYVAQFSKKLKTNYQNFAQAGCNNIQILDNVIDKSSRFKEDDLVLIGFTSSLRDNLPYFPTQITKGIAMNNDVFKTLTHMKIDFDFRETNGKEFSDFFQDYSSFYFTEMFDEKYYEIFNYNIIVFLQKFFEYKKINYIMLDAFDNMLNKKLKHIDTKYYWNFNKKTIFSYISSFKDKNLLEKKGYNASDITPRHPSIEGHKVFAEELYRYYKEIYI